MLNTKELENKIIEAHKKNKIDFEKWIKSKEPKIDKIILKAVSKDKRYAYFPFIAEKEYFLNFSKDFFSDKGYSVNIYIGKRTGIRFFKISW